MKSDVQLNLRATGSRQRDCSSMPLCGDRFTSRRTDFHSETACQAAGNDPDRRVFNFNDEHMRSST